MSGCLPLPVVPILALPDGINLIPQLPKATFPVPNPCCLLPVPSSITLAVVLPPGVVNTGVGTLLKTYSLAARKWINSLQPTCPRQ